VVGVVGLRVGCFVCIVFRVALLVGGAIIPLVVDRFCRFFSGVLVWFVCWFGGFALLGLGG
jgi:hypothetical protein